MYEEVFVPYEMAVGLESIGYDSHSITYYTKNIFTENKFELHPLIQTTFLKKTDEEYFCGYRLSDIKKNSKSNVLAPTYEQAFEFIYYTYGFSYVINTSSHYEAGKPKFKSFLVTIFHTTDEIPAFKTIDRSMQLYTLKEVRNWSLKRMIEIILEIEKIKSEGLSDQELKPI